ncbi:MAG: glycosyltransferase family 2 protein [Planctomycetes bacterium]|nr:glycosyltransferase family 2 protein [Planctomycetota bacterium]
MTNDLPLTLAMVSYNKKDTIDLCIASAAQGTRKPDLIVVSDDGSNDGTQGTAERHARKWGIPCRVIKHQRVGRYRLQAMRNTCVSNALDGVVLLTDSDCIFGPYALEAHMAIHRTHGWAVGTGPRYEYLEGTSGPFMSTCGTLEYTHVDERHYCVPVGANFSFRKSLWKILGGFDRVFDGSYGMDEFAFSACAERFGAVCVSDPLAYLFHCPHESVFGRRDSSRNIGVFNDTYGRRHEDEERDYLARVIPSYWSGNRRTSLLGPKEEFDEWGAPAGFEPPMLLRLSRTLAPLIDLAENCLEVGSAGAVKQLGDITKNLDWRRLAPGSVALGFLERLHRVVHSGRPHAEVADMLREYVDAAKAADLELARANARAASS